MRSRTYRLFAACLTLLVAMMLAGCPAQERAPSASNTATVPPSAVTQPQPSSPPAATPTDVVADQLQPTTTTEPTRRSTAKITQQPADDGAENTPAFVETAEPATANQIATLERLYNTLPPRRDPVQLAYEFGRTDSLERIARTEPLDVQVGDTETFNVKDILENRNYQISATLVLALEHVLVYVEDGVAVDMAELERSARDFNDRIYPRTRELFGSEASPGVDGDPRLTILNARLSPSIGGYFSGSDTVPHSVNRFSNEREMFYINIDNRIPGTDSYGDVLAHEFQHMIQWNEAERPAIWFNEGMAKLAEELNGYEESVVDVAPAYLVNPDVQLTTWSSQPQDALPHYGAAYLFMTYFYQHYGHNLDLRQLIRDGAGERLELFAQLANKQNSEIETFGDLYADWAVANLLNDPGYNNGRYAYAQLPATVELAPLTSATLSQNIAQFGSQYWELPPSDGERVVRFDGSETVGIVAAEPEGEVMWWSNRGDNAHTALARSFDLRDVASATLAFRLWFDIEQDYDYGFVSVSTDGGQTWTTHEGRHTTTEDPQGANWGHGYTGTSGSGPEPAWVDEQIDLTPYAGHTIMIRFSLITDDAVNEPGMALDNIRIDAIGFSDDVETDAAGWTAQGFARIDNQLPQRWEVRLVRIGSAGLTVELLQLDASNMGEYRLAPGERGALLVAATTPHTTERAAYQLSVLQP